MKDFLKLTRVKKDGNSSRIMVGKNQISMIFPSERMVESEYGKKKAFGTKIIMAYNAFQTDIFVEERFEDIEMMLNED